MMILIEFVGSWHDVLMLMLMLMLLKMMMWHDVESEEDDADNAELTLKSVVGTWLLASSSSFESDSSSPLSKSTVKSDPPASMTSSGEAISIVDAAVSDLIACRDMRVNQRVAASMCCLAIFTDINAIHQFPNPLLVIHLLFHHFLACAERWQSDERTKATNFAPKSLEAFESISSSSSSSSSTAAAKDVICSCVLKMRWEVDGVTFWWTEF